MHQTFRAKHFKRNYLFLRGVKIAAEIFHNFSRTQCVYWLDDAFKISRKTPNERIPWLSDQENQEKV